MSKPKPGSHLDHKSKRFFFCCGCFGSNRSESSSTMVGISHPNDPYEYVVEKLAIKKVPLSLFATPEDLEKHSRSISSNATATSSTYGQPLEKPKPIPVTVAAAELSVHERPSVTFSAYYKMAPKTDLEHVSFSAVPEGEPSASDEIELNYEEQEIVCSPATLHRKTSKRTRTSDQEAELVQHILNKHSSLFTLDAKEAVPKDPDNAPRNKVIIPPLVQAALHNNRQPSFPPLEVKKQFQVDVHRTSVQPPPVIQAKSPPSSMPPMKYPTAIPQSKKDMTPELKKTINLLGLAQKPHNIPGLPPKNQKCLEETESEGYIQEQEVGCHLLGSDLVAESVSEHELSCLTLNSKEKPARSPIFNRKLRRVSIQSDESDYEDRCGSSSSKMESLESANIMSFSVPRFSKKLTIQQCNAESDEKSVLAIPNTSSNQIRLLTRCNEESSTLEPKLQDSEQVTEISQLKGQSLKWKIIIKHHSDNKKQCPQESSERSEDSDTDSGSKNYMLDSESSSPHR